MTISIKAVGTQAADQPLAAMQIARRDRLSDDVQIEILYCGICNSDHQPIKNDFGMTYYPAMREHEIVGRLS